MSILNNFYLGENIKFFIKFNKNKDALILASEMFFSYSF